MHQKHRQYLRETMTMQSLWKIWPQGGHGHHFFRDNTTDVLIIHLDSEPSPETDESDVGTRDPSLKRTYVGLPNIWWICCRLLFRFCWFLPLLVVGRRASFHGLRSKVLVNPHIVVSSTLCQIWIKGSKTELSLILKHVFDIAPPGSIALQWFSPSTESIQTQCAEIQWSIPLEWAARPISILLGTVCRLYLLLL